MRRCIGGRAQQLSVSIRTIDYHLQAKTLRTRRIGRKVLIPHAELVRFASRDHWERVDGRDGDQDGEK
ncbi:MAG TPA: hypothetical protein VK638_52320 [Edaphobacter sp.]|nr:hypothetical protein [Edaphobacter sp.]